VIETLLRLSIYCLHSYPPRLVGACCNAVVKLFALELVFVSVSIFQFVFEFCCPSRAPMLRRAAGELRRWAQPAAARPCASACDSILLSGLVFHGHHGVLAAERELGQKFTVDVSLACDLRAAGERDALADTLCYATVHECVRRCLARAWLTAVGCAEW